MKTIFEMAREAGFVLAGKFTTRIHGYDRDGDYTEELKAFAALVRADERELVLAAAIDGAEHAARKAVADEREACANVCEEQDELRGHTPFHCAAAIRARGKA